MQKELDSYLIWFLYIRYSNLQRNIKEIYKKGNNSATKNFFLNIIVLEHYRGKKPILCQRVSQSDSKCREKREHKDKQKDKHTFSYLYK